MTAEIVVPDLTVSVDLMGVLANKTAFSDTYGFNFVEEERRVREGWRNCGTRRLISDQVGARFMDVFMKEVSKPENGVLNRDVINALVHFKAEAHKNARGLNLVVVTRLPVDTVPVFLQKYPDLNEVIDSFVGNNGNSYAESLEPVLRGLRENGTVPYLVISNDVSEIKAFQRENIHKFIYYGGNQGSEERKRDFAEIQKMQEASKDPYCRFVATDKVSGPGSLEESLYSMFFS